MAKKLNWMQMILVESTSRMFPRLLVALENELPKDQFYSRYKGSEQFQLHYTGVGLVNACIQASKLVFTNNATEIVNDTLIWNFGIDSLLDGDYTLQANSIIYNFSPFQKLILTVITLLLCIFLLVRTFFYD